MNLIKRNKDIERKEKIKEIMLKYSDYGLYDIQKVLKINSNHIERYYMLIRREFKRSKINV